ncbi:MAG: zinc ABC transporter solute-binding protein [Epsilonproteobacteria bacterium]|nr:zinc ABC transporter solute-binding protein [Campylobacterota bacterium]
MRSFLLFSLLLLPLFAKPIVAISILPQKYILDKITQDSFEVVVLLPPKVSPATFSPKPSTVLKLKKASLYLTIGLPFEKALLEKIETKKVDMGKYLKRFSHFEHLDPHIWLSPPHLLLLARVTLEEAIKLQPSKKGEFLRNYLDFVKEITALDTSFFNQLPSNTTFISYHPSFGYFAKVYNLKQLAIEKEGKEPKPQQLLQLLKTAREEKVKVVVVEPQFPKRKAKFLAQKINAKIVVIDPLAYDIPSSLKKLTDALSDLD